MSQIQVTVIIPVKNEANIIRNCLNKLVEFNQVIVLDSNSTDETAIIVLEYLNCEYKNFNWNGKFPKKRNWALDNLLIKNDFVLFIDADEVLTDGFISEIKNVIINKKYVGFWLFYDNYFLNKKMNYGIKMKKLALFNKNYGRYEMINDNNWTNFDMEIHEHPILNGPISIIQSPIIHNDFKNINSFILKHNEYSSWEAMRYLSLNNKNILTYRQKFKYFLLPRSILSILYFMYAYFIKLGFLDGKRGLIYTILKSIYFYLISIKIYELKLTQNQDKETFKINKSYDN